MSHSQRRGVRAQTAFSLALADPVVDADALPTTARWAGPIGMEGELTGDGRAIAHEALRWDCTPENPIPLRYVRSDVGAHDGAEVAGSIFAISRRPGGVIWGEGDLDMGSDAGKSAYRALRDKRQNGVSMDLDDVSFEVRIAAELAQAMNEPMTDELVIPAVNPDGTVTVATIHSDDEIMLTTSARVRAATQVAVPAFSNARIALLAVGPEDLDDDDTPPGSDELALDVVDVSDDPVLNAQAQAEADVLLAAAAPLLPPGAWFERAEFSGPQALTITPEGRVYGHLAMWGSCHVSHSAGGRCVTPPNSPSGYAWFHTGAIETAEGDLWSIGHLTMGTGHASDELSPAETLSHYDNTGTVAADVVAYEDQWGIAVVGALRPHLTPEQVRAFRAAPLSGDWRRVGSHLELVAALSVNVPGFGVPRPSGHIVKDNLVSLMASGMIIPVSDHVAQTLTAEDVRYLQSFVERSRRTELAALAARRNKVKVATFARRRREN